MASEKKIKKNQYIIFGVIAVFLVGGLMIGMYVSDPNKHRLSPAEQRLEKSKEVKKQFSANPSDTVSDKEFWISRSETRFQGSEKRLATLETANVELQKRLDSFLSAASDKKFNVNNNLPSGLTPAPDVRTSKNPLFPSFTPPVESPPVTDTVTTPSMVSNTNTLAKAATKVVPRVSGNGSRSNNNEDEIIMLDLSSAEEGEKPKKYYSSYMPAGSIMTAVMLKGVDAPTGGLAKTNPVPVLFRLMDAGILPNFFDSDVGNCHVTGEAWGEISSERVYIRTNLLSCILADGEVIEVPVKATVAGEDGKDGVRGNVVSKQGSLIAYAALSGLASGLGTSINDQYQTISTNALGSISTVNPNDALKSGLAQGFSNSMEKVSDFWLARANETYPVIEVGSKRIVEITTTAGVEFGQDIIGKTRQEK